MDVCLNIIIEGEGFCYDLKLERTDYVVERFDFSWNVPTFILERSDHTVERSDVERSDLERSDCKPPLVHK